MIELLKKTASKSVTNKVLIAVFPLIFFGLSCFFVHNWQESLVKKEQLLSNYLTTSELDGKFVSIAQYNEYIGKIDATTKSVKELHDDVKLMLIGMATMHPELRGMFLKHGKKEKDLPFPDDPKPENPTRLASGG